VGVSSGASNGHEALCYIIHCTAMVSPLQGALRYRPALERRVFAPAAPYRGSA